MLQWLVQNASAFCRCLIFIACLILVTPDAIGSGGDVCDLLARGIVRLNLKPVDKKDYVALAGRLEELATYLQSQSRLIPGTPRTDQEELLQMINRDVVANSRLDEKVMRQLSAQLKGEVSLNEGEDIHVHVLSLQRSEQIFIAHALVDLVSYFGGGLFKQDLDSSSIPLGAVVLAQNILLNLAGLFQAAAPSEFAANWTHRFIAFSTDMPTQVQLDGPDGRQDPALISFVLLPDLSDPMNYAKAKLVLVQKFTGLQPNQR